MTNTKIQTEFFNVPKPHKYQDPPLSLICEGCQEVVEHPLHVFSCQHNLCGACWQKSAYNFWGNKNECMVCHTPTDLVCYRDYWRFIGKNLFERGIYIENTKNLLLDDLIMYCNVSGCDYKAKRPNVLLHEKECWRLERCRKMETAKEAAAAEDTIQQDPPCPQLEFQPNNQAPKSGSPPYTQHPKPTPPSAPAVGSQTPSRKSFKRK